jgi:cell division septation protein DedD
MLASDRRVVYYSRVRGRLFSLSIIALAACSDRGPAGDNVAAFAAAYGQDPIALRVARGGGPLRAYQYPRLDSLIWTSTQAVGAQARILAFDPENGLEAFVDRSGVPGWIDLRVGTVRPSRTPKLDLMASMDAGSIFGVTDETLVHRSTPSGEWEFKTSDPVNRLFPTPDGGLIILTSNASTAKLVRLRPPERTIVDSVQIPLPNFSAMSPLGDRLYLAFGSDVAALTVSTFDEAARVRFDGPVSALVTTPSGDRVFVATERSADVAILDRYSGERTEAVKLPGIVKELRMDPLGRLLLARPDTGDSVWVISVGTNQLVATLPAVWRADLPTVAHDGTVASVVDRDVHFTMPGGAKPRIIIRDGASEIWHFVFWNGFRPRASVLDQPVVFPVDTTYYVEPASDSLMVSSPQPLDTSAVTRPQVIIPADTSSRITPARSGWSVQVAAVLSEERAREIARTIRVDGATPRITVSEVDGSRVYRVVMGPFPTRADADRVGRQSGRDYWVFEGVP